MLLLKSNQYFPKAQNRETGKMESANFKRVAFGANKGVAGNKAISLWTGQAGFLPGQHCSPS